VSGYRWNVRDVDLALILRLRILALRQGRPLGQLVNEALRDYLEKEEPRSEPFSQPENPAT